MKVMLPIVTKDAMRILEACFKGVSTRSGLRKIEMSIDKSAFHILYCMTRTDEDPCGKQHFREIPTPDFVSKCTDPTSHLV
jgi:hypothetical protein